MDQPSKNMAPEVERKVCVVDDDVSVRNALKRLLSAACYKVTAFSSAEEFLASGVGDTCSCAILDVRMPGMDGLALQEKLSALNSELPVIFLTARDEAWIEKKAMRNGALQFFNKTVSGKELLDAVRAAMGG
jgi:two-component system, LuxR family, response regulator FixJ